RVLVGRMVQHQLGDDSNSALVGRGEQLLKIGQRAVGRVDARIFGDVVAVVLQRRWIKRQEPDDGDAEILQVVELLRQAPKVADAVADAVVERTHVQLG